MKKNIELKNGYKFGIIDGGLHIIKEISEEEAVNMINKNNTWERADDISEEVEKIMNDNIFSSLFICKTK